MSTVFISGSISIKRLDPAFTARMANIVTKNLPVIMGDADGADKAIQAELKHLGARNVTIFCSGSTPRHNLDDWPTERVTSSARPGTRAFFTAKDLEMAARAEYGLMMWNGSSPGTLSNVIELTARGMKSVIYLDREKDFVTVKEPADIYRLVDLMSDEAMASADRKIDLSAKLFDMCDTQADFEM